MKEMSKVKTFLEGNIDSNQYRFNEDCHAIIQPEDFKNFNEK